MLLEIQGMLLACTIGGEGMLMANQDPVLANRQEE